MSEPADRVDPANVPVLFAARAPAPDGSWLSSRLKPARWQRRRVQAAARGVARPRFARETEVTTPVARYCVLSANAPACDVLLYITACDVNIMTMPCNLHHSERLRRRSIADTRALHILDIENLAGGPNFTPNAADALRRQYEAIVPFGPDDLVVIASSHYGARTAWFSWPHARHLVRSGPDGADLALIGVLENERVAERFQTVILGSGDGIFAEPCARLQAAGCGVTVVSGAGMLSRRLAFAVRDLISLQPDDISCTARVLRTAA